MLRHLSKTGWIVSCLILFTFSTSCSSSQTDDDLPAQIQRVENGLLTYHAVTGEPAHTIEDRMRYYNVPGVSVAVIENGELLWARGWGETEAGSGVAVDSETLFQAASISKPVASAGALRLVEKGYLNLDEDVNGLLQSWKVPENGFTLTEKVTLRRLLSHSAGTNVHGFPGYAEGEAVPSVIELLSGEEPSNTEAVQVHSTPGSGWRYSGGGTTIMQLLMADVTGRSFEEIMQKEVLEPIGMIHSTFSQPLTEEFEAEAATGHLGDGTPLEGRYHTYPEQAAAGLWTTPSDLAHFAIDIQNAYKGAEGHTLSPEMARTMMATEAGSWGLGFSIDSVDGRDFRFSHGGSNAGFKAYFTMMANQGLGAVIMTNGDQGTDLGMEILRAIAHEYDLPGYEPIVRTAITLEEKQLSSYTGRYYVTGQDGSLQFMMELRIEDNTLLADVPSVGWQGKELRAESESTHFFIDNRGELTFQHNEEGEVISVAITNLGPPLILEPRR